MDITPYAERLRIDLAQTAAGGSDEVREAAERLNASLEPALRLSLMEVLSEAAAEITSAMRSGTVEARLHGRDIEFVVDDAVVPVAPRPVAEPADEDDEGTLARITLRLPESIKARAEELAARHGSSLNTWIVNVLRTATRENAVNIDIDLSSLPFLDSDFPRGSKGGSRRMSGWV
ncbi:toxin-antitoxin system HicB family antitoxin [Nocardioides terrisoli]|uniref:toxin-antitoxin system HicB family antitoxin n=1 Tax=Nocardioides terrisoli TaxID=3388267 RepID=UPI00287B8383|nr:toxin-antitoxin system HicB family antitoxin [Nocardioides marmorisolisilvae]